MGFLPWLRVQTCILVISDILQFNVFPIVYKYSIIYLLNITVIIFKCITEHLVCNPEIYSLDKMIVRCLLTVTLFVIFFYIIYLFF